MKLNKVPSSVWTNPLHFIAFGFGSGAFPVAPGTAGTILAIPIYYALSFLSFPIYLSITIIATILAIILCDYVSKQIKVHDHPGMAIDEIIGYLVTMIAAPKGWIWILTGFALFRIFDILKPWPISWIDREVGGGFGIIIDDVVAGIASLIIIQLLAWWLL